MAEKTVLECDNANNRCNGSVKSWHLWIDGDTMSTRVDLCEVHARPLRDTAAMGRKDGLPSKKRQAMEVTVLKPTSATKHLKKRP